MENEDSAMTFGLLLCLAVAILGLVISSGSTSEQEFGPTAADRALQTGQILVLD